MNWQNFQLKEITQRITKGTTPTSIGHSFQNEGVNYIKAESFNDSGRFINEKFAFITHECNSALKRSILNENDILFTIAGVLGRCTIVNKEILPANTNQAVAIIRLDRTKKILPEYVRYWLSQDIVRKKVNKEKIQSAQPNINLKQLGDLEIKVPCIDIQKQLILIIKTYDDLIENNLKRINLLEQAAQNIYKEWFVNMRFPGYEIAEFDSATGLPMGWELISAFDLFEIKGGTQPPKSQWAEEQKDGYTRMIQIRDYYTDSHIAYVKDTVKLRKCSATDIMIARYGASVGRICWGLEGAYNVALVKVIPKNEEYTEYIRWYLKSYLFQESLLAMTQRTAQDGFNKDTFKSISAVNPGKKIVNRFESLTLPMLHLMKSLNLQNQKLKAARDILLPRLMNQTIEV